MSLSSSLPMLENMDSGTQLSSNEFYHLRWIALGKLLLPMDFDFLIFKVRYEHQA